MPSDYWKASRASDGISDIELKQLKVEAKLTQFHESMIHHRQSITQLQGPFLQLACDGEALYFQWVDQYFKFMSSTKDDRQDQLQELEIKVGELLKRQSALIKGQSETEQSEQTKQSEQSAMHTKSE